MFRHYGKFGYYPSYSVKPEPEFFNILKCNLAKSASTGFQFNCYDIFNEKTQAFGPLFISSVKFTEQNLFYHKKNCSQQEPYCTL
jgi:hypothetical protein